MRSTTKLSSLRSKMSRDLNGDVSDLRRLLYASLHSVPSPPSLLPAAPSLSPSVSSSPNPGPASNAQPFCVDGGRDASHLNGLLLSMASAPGWMVIDGVGPLTLPLSTAQAVSILQVSETFAANQVTLSPAWVSVVQDVATAHVHKLFGGDGATEQEKPKVTNVKAELQMVQVQYDKHGLCKYKYEYADNNKDKVLGTLIVQLPSSHEGGLLYIIRSGPQTAGSPDGTTQSPSSTTVPQTQVMVYDWSSDSGMALHTASFVVDCQHEVSQVSNGFKLCMLYSIEGDRVVPAEKRVTTGEKRQVQDLSSSMADLSHEQRRLLIETARQQLVDAANDWMGLHTRANQLIEASGALRGGASVNGGGNGGRRGADSSVDISCEQQVANIKDATVPRVLMFPLVHSYKDNEKEKKQHKQQQNGERRDGRTSSMVTKGPSLFDRLRGVDACRAQVIRETGMYALFMVLLARGGSGSCSNNGKVNGDNADNDNTNGQCSGTRNSSGDGDGEIGRAHV